MKRGFTLIEMLVVIAIIAIMAAILVPVVSAARARARSDWQPEHRRVIVERVIIEDVTESGESSVSVEREVYRTHRDETTDLWDPTNPLSPLNPVSPLNHNNPVSPFNMDN